MASQAQTLANQQNATLSTGPRTVEGKYNASKNSFKHGLTANVVVLSTEDQTIYEEFCRRMLADYEPLGAMEEQYAQIAIDAKWRLHRVIALENNFFALAQCEPVPEHLADIENLQTLAALMQANALIKYDRELRNLHLQEQRLHRIAQNALNDLGTLKELRAEPEPEAKPAPAPAPAPARPTAPAPQKIGFDFTSRNPQPYPKPQPAPAPAKPTAPAPADPKSAKPVPSSNG